MVVCYNGILLKLEVVESLAFSPFGLLNSGDCEAAASPVVTRDWMLDDTFIIETNIDLIHSSHFDRKQQGNHRC